MKTGYYHRRIILAFVLLVFLCNLSYAQERGLDTLRKIAAKDTIRFQPLFSESEQGLKTVVRTPAGERQRKLPMI